MGKTTNKTVTSQYEMFHNTKQSQSLFKSFIPSVLVWVIQKWVLMCNYYYFIKIKYHFKCELDLWYDICTHMCTYMYTLKLILTFKFIFKMTIAYILPDLQGIYISKIRFFIVGKSWISILSSSRQHDKLGYYYYYYCLSCQWGQERGLG